MCGFPNVIDCFCYCRVPRHSTADIGCYLGIENAYIIVVVEYRVFVRPLIRFGSTEGLRTAGTEKFSVYS